MKKIFYLPALIAAIAIVALCSSCGGVHPPAKKAPSTDTTQSPTPGKVDMSAVQTPVKKMISGILSIISFSLHNAYWSFFFVSLCTVLANAGLRRKFIRLLYGRYGPLLSVQKLG
jgi:hypothetical protein